MHLHPGSATDVYTVMNDVQVKRTRIIAYQIKTWYAFPPRNQLQVRAMVWLVWIKISRM